MRLLSAVLILLNSAVSAFAEEAKAPYEPYFCVSAEEVFSRDNRILTRLQEARPGKILGKFEEIVSSIIKGGRLALFHPVFGLQFRNHEYHPVVVEFAGEERISKTVLQETEPKGYGLPIQVLLNLKGQTLIGFSVIRPACPVVQCEPTIDKFVCRGIR